MKRTLLILLAAAVLIIVGVVLEQHTAVLNKAIYVCLECIGIG